MNRHALIVAAAAIAGIVAGTLGLTGVFSSSDISPSAAELEPVDHAGQSAAAPHLPADVRDVFSDRERGFDALGSVYVRIDEKFIDEENYCEFCVGVEYKPGPLGKATVAFKSRTPVDLSNATILTFDVRGEKGGEKMRIFAAGTEDISGNGTATPPSSDSSGLRNVKFAVDKQVTLSKDWRTYEVRLDGLNLRELTYGFAFQMINDTTKRQVIYVDAIFYDTKHSDYATVFD